MRVRVRDREFNTLMLPNLSIRPLRYRTEAQGGHKWADIRVDAKGDQRALWQILNWLRYDIEIQDDYGRALWWGYVDSLGVGTGGRYIGVGLGDMANRIAALYSNENDSGVTAWAEDAASIANYGVKELLISVPDATEAVAEYKRDWMLTKLRYPTSIVEEETRGQSHATLRCVGWLDSLEWTYYDRDEGLEEYASSAGVGQKVGWGFTSSKVGFTARGNSMSELDSKLNELRKGDKIRVTGTSGASNDDTYTVESSSTKEPATYTADTIAFLQQRRRAVNEYIRASHDKWRNLNNFNLWGHRALAVTTLSAQSGVTGTHTGGGDSANLTDSTKTWTTNEWVDRRIKNITDGSEGTVKSNTVDTIVASLFGGVDNDWDNGDSYVISPNEIWVADASTVASGDRIRVELDSAAYHETFVRGTPDTATGKVSLEDALPSIASSLNDIDLVYRWVTDAGGSTFYVEGTDYDFEGDGVTAADGQIRAKSTGAIANNQVMHVSYSYNEYRIEDSDIGLGLANAADMIQVTGSTSNNSYKRVLSAGQEGDRLTVREQVTDEAPGATVTIARGSSILIEETPVDELPGSSVTVVAWGDRVLQSFEVTSVDNWTVDKIWVRVRKVGSPSDNLTVIIRDGNASTPGAILEDVEISPADISTQLSWTVAQFLNTYELVAGSVYWVHVERSGSDDPLNYYEIAVDENADFTGGALKLWDGNAYQDRPVNADMPFRVLGAEKTTTQIEVLVDQEGQFLNGTDILDVSGLDLNQWRDGRTTARTELLDLLDMGTNNGLRLLGTVRQDRVLRVEEEPEQPSLPDYRMNIGGRIKATLGATLPTGSMDFVGQWVAIADLPPTADFTYINAPSPFFVEAAECDVEDAKYIIQPAGGAPVWRVGMSIDEG